MKYNFPVIFLISCLIFSVNVFAQKPEEPTFRLYLIGDAGDDDTTEATLLDLGKKLHENPNSAVVFLGDNCYRKAMYGLLPMKVKGYDGSKITVARVMSQLNILKGYEGWAYFIPGNHDWWNYTNLRYGKRALLKQEKFIESVMKGKDFSTLKSLDNIFIPDGGSPGPVFREFNEGKTRVIFIDSYRLILGEGDRKRDTLILNAFYRNLKTQLAEGTAKKQKIIVVAHHPIHAKGRHSLPLVGWQKMVRRFADSNTNYPPYGSMAQRLDSLLKLQHRPDIYYVAGHEHSLEYFFNDSLHYIVSGAGSKTDHVDYKETVKENEYFIWNEEGFFEIEFYGRFERLLIHHRKDLKSPLEVHCITGCELTTNK
ncbi:MAG: metallophosphoesterase family protein [Bacteroidia bacterium]